MPFGMLVADDARGERVRLNPAAAALLGVAPDENVSASTLAGARLRRAVLRGGRPVRPDELPVARALAGDDLRNY